MTLVIAIVFVGAFRPHQTLFHLADVSHMAREGWTKTKAETPEVFESSAIVVHPDPLHVPDTIAGRRVATAVSRSYPGTPVSAMLGPPPAPSAS